MRSSYIYVPLLILCAPVILVVVASFTTLAFVTSTLALVIIAIRLGLLAMEFSGGVALDAAGWGIKTLVGDNHNVNVVGGSAGTGMNSTNFTGKHHGKKHKDKIPSRHHNYKNGMKQHPKHSPVKVAMWDVDTLKSKNIDNIGNTLISNDDYFHKFNGIANRRPIGRRARSDFV